MRAPRTTVAVGNAGPATLGYATRGSRATAAVAANTTARAQNAGFIAIDPEYLRTVHFQQFMLRRPACATGFRASACPYRQEYLRIRYRLPLHGDSPASARKSPQTLWIPPKRQPNGAQRQKYV